MKRALIVANPVSGNGSGLAKAVELERALLERGIESEIAQTKIGDDAALDAKIVASPLVIAVGGDGTLNRVTRPLILAGNCATVAGLFACGTGNVAARAFALPRTAHEIAARVADPNLLTIDAGIATREGETIATFILWLGAGLDASLIESVAARRSTIRGARLIAEYVMQACRVGMTYRFDDIDVISDSVAGRFASVMVANIGRIAIGSLTTKADPSDGLLDVIATAPRSRAAWFYAGMLGGLSLYDRCANVDRGRAMEIHLTSDERVPIHVDGEPLGKLPVSVAVKHAALKLLR